MTITKEKYVTIISPTKEILSFCKRILTIDNPAYDSNSRLGVSNFATQRTLKYYEYKDDVLKVPIGFWEIYYPHMECTDLRTEFISEEVSNLTFNGTLREEQTAAVEALRGGQGVLSASTGVGKTVVGLKLIQELNLKALFLVDSIELAKQFIKRCKTFLDYDAGFIGSGKFIVKDISVGILQTLMRMDEEKMHIINSNFSVAIVDECHLVPAEVFFFAINRFKGKYRFGLSATVKGRKDGLDDVILWGIGPVRYEIKLEDAAKDLTIPSFEFVETSFEFPIFNSREYSLLLDFLSKDTDRNQIIIDSRQKYKDKKCIILVARREHAKLLSELIPGSEYMTSDFKTKDREKIINRFTDGSTTTLIGTIKLLAKGLDIPDIEMMILAAPTNSEIDVKQSLGRCMRKGDGKKESIIIDIVDSKIGMLNNMAKHRKTWYKRYTKLTKLK